MNNCPEHNDFTCMLHTKVDTMSCGRRRLRAQKINLVGYSGWKTCRLSVDF